MNTHGENYDYHCEYYGDQAIGLEIRPNADGGRLNANGNAAPHDFSEDLKEGAAFHFSDSTPPPVSPCGRARMPEAPRPRHRNTPARPPLYLRTEEFVVPTHDKRTVAADPTKLVARRRALCWSQATLSQRAGVSEDTVSRAENGKAIRLGLAEVLAKTLEAPLAALLAGEDPLAPTGLALASDYFLASTLNSPEIDFRISERKLSVRGSAFFDDPDFFRETKMALVEALNSLGDHDVEFVFDLNLVASANSVWLYDTILLLSRAKCSSLIVRWKFDEHDEDVIALGKMYQTAFEKNAVSGTFSFFCQKKSS